MDVKEVSPFLVDPRKRVCLITGANTGIGAATAFRMAEAGYHVFLAGRSRQRTLPVSVSWVRPCIYLCLRVCVCMCVCICMCVCVCVCMCV